MQNAPVVSNERPQRFVLTSGTTVIGTKIGEDAEFYTVQTQSGPVRIRKADISYIDFQTGGGGQIQGAPVVQQPIVAAPAPAPPAPERRGSKSGTALFVTGLSVFAGFYFITIMVGAIASIADSDANWLFVPAAGPMLYYTIGDLDKGALGILMLTTIAQSAGLVVMILGAVLMGSSDDEASRPGFRVADGVNVMPSVAPDAAGLSAALQF